MRALRSIQASALLIATAVVIVGLVVSVAMASSRSQFQISITGGECPIDLLSDGTAIEKLALPPGCEPEPPEPPPDEPAPTEPPPTFPPIIPPLLNPALLPAGGSALLGLIAKSTNITIDTGSSPSDHGFWNWTAVTLFAMVIMLLMVICINMAIYQFTGVSFLGSAIARLKGRYYGQLPAPKKDKSKR